MSSGRALLLPPEASGQRYDHAVREALAAAGHESSAREVRQALREGRIRVEGRRAAPGARARGGESIDLGEFVPRSEATIRSEPELLLTIRVLFEDPTILALDKPSGIPTHPLAHDEASTLLGAAVAHDPAIARAGPPLEGGLVHRLDRGTSGVVIFAKDVATRERLRDAFARGRIEKRYRALVFDPERRLVSGQVLEGAIAPAADPRRVEVTGADSTGALAARTEIVSVSPGRAGWAWVEVQAHTGRRHQIRAHLASVGAPIGGDPLYGSAAPDRAGLSRLALHAASVLLPEGLLIEAPLPADLAALEREDRT